MVVHNAGGDADALTAAQCALASAAELHSSALVDGVMRMRPIDAVEVPARGRAVLEPGGRHVMLIGLRQPLTEDAPLALTLRFERAGEVTLQVPVRAPGAPAPAPPGPPGG
jgi:copper(I)-binding protein